MEIPERVAKRAYYKATKSPTGCHISTYSTASHGYAQVGWGRNGEKRQMALAHRCAWVYAHGQIPDSLTVDHLPTCDRRCVNVDHLRLLPNLENARRTFGRDWPLGECVHGHPNSEWRPSGPERKKGYCRSCKDIWQENYKSSKSHYGGKPRNSKMCPIGDCLA